MRICVQTVDIINEFRVEAGCKMLADANFRENISTL